MWFTTECNSKGQGKAEFSDIKGTIEGEAEIQFDESGNPIATMKFSRLTTDEDLPFGLFQFLNGQEATMFADGAVGIGFGGGQNTCSLLTVETPEGIFTSREGLSFSYSINTSDDTETVLHFNLQQRKQSIGFYLSATLFQNMLIGGLTLMVIRCDLDKRYPLAKGTGLPIKW